MQNQNLNRVFGFQPSEKITNLFLKQMNDGHLLLSETTTIPLLHDYPHTSEPDNLKIITKIVAESTEHTKNEIVSK